MTDILKIQKTIRKAIKDYTIAAKHDEEVLVALVSVDIYLALEEAPVVTKMKRNNEKSHDTPKDIVTLEKLK